jgi:hypothetical protein
MGLHFLSFGARISDSFVEMLKSTTAQARAEWPGALPYLCVEERRHSEISGTETRNKRVDFALELKCASVNRTSEERPPILVTERFWVIRFDRKKWPENMSFLLDGLEVHIDLEEQRELKGTRLDFVNYKIVATFDAV